MRAVELDERLVSQQRGHWQASELVEAATVAGHASLGWADAGSIEVGQRVMMSSGIYGTVRSIDDERARLEIAPGTEIEIARAAIAKVDAPVSRQVDGPVDDA